MVSPTIVTKLQFIRVKQNMFTLADKESGHIMKMTRDQTKIANTTRLTREETTIPKQRHFLPTM